MSNGSNRRAPTDKRTDTHGRYQTYCLSCYAVDKYTNNYSNYQPPSLGLRLTDLTAELLNAADDLCHVSSVEEVDRLEQTRLGHSVRLAEVHERLNVLHLHSQSPTC